ncbi:transmembrane and coiled-coil domain-containing protein 6 isoform X2 [Parus major]|uniref:transmembrane and coiled-coil domain-containing protein 6 isoform X2 n=1 Tax=Parus major TaxID=9157 RepID=UPI0007711434|nr:transmembrane and coiled-coil domain-containing protein 6 isoform X2 [Parus major]
MWGRRRARRGGHSAEELRERRREREAALRRARRQEQLVSKRLLREDSAAEEGGQDGADVVPDPLSEDEVLELLRGVQRGSEDRQRSLGRLRWALQNEETQQKFVRLDGSIRTLTGLFTSSLAELQLEAARCLHELSHSSVPTVAEACLPVTSYLLTYLSGHSLELTELCLYTLGNLVVESQAVRKQLLPQGIIPVLASCIQSPHEAVLEGVGYVLSQLLQAKEAPMEIIPLVLDSVLPQHMLRLVCSGLKAAMGAAVEFAWCLHYIICRHKDNEVLLALGAVPALTSLLLDLASQIPQDVPEGLELCFLQQHPFLVQECLWLLNNLTADDPFLCSALLSLELLPALLQLLTCSQMATVLVNPAPRIGNGGDHWIHNMNPTLTVLELEGGWGSSDSWAEGPMWWQSPATSPKATPAVFSLGRALSQHKSVPREMLTWGPGAGLGRLLPLSFERPQSFRRLGMLPGLWVARLGLPGTGMNSALGRCAGNIPNPVVCWALGCGQAPGRTRKKGGEGYWARG